MLDKNMLFDFLDNLSHLVLSSSSYNPKMDNNEDKMKDGMKRGKRIESVFLNLMDSKSFKIHWNDSNFETGNATFSLNSDNVELVKFLVIQENISNNFKDLMDQNMVRVAKTIGVDLPEVLSKELIEKKDSIKKHKL